MVAALVAIVLAGQLETGVGLAAASGRRLDPTSASAVDAANGPTGTPAGATGPAANATNDGRPAAPGQGRARPDRAYVPNTVLVAYKHGTTVRGKGAARRSVKATSSKPLSPLAKDTEKLKLPVGSSVEDAIRTLKQDPNVRFAEPDHIVSVDATSNDPLYQNGSLWGMESGGSSPANAFGTGARDAWAAGFTGSRNVVVGVVDEGIEITHPDLAANIWTNPWEIPGNTIDDDGNGYVDDIHGWDFLHDDASVDDGPSVSGHGTHVAGTIGGVGGNGIGVAGVNWAVTMISAKFLEGSGDTSDAVAALDYLTDLKIRHGLDIVATNDSWGGGAFDQALLDAINRGGDAGILFVGAAGNAASNDDSTPFYPSSSACTTRFDTGLPRSWDCIVSVAAIDATGALAGFSNYGAGTVDIGAPGDGIVSTYPPSTYGSLSGTSMATPHVTGAIALLAACNGGLGAEQLRGHLLADGTSTSSLAGKTVTGRRLNIAAMTAACDTSGPPKALLIAPPGYVTGNSFDVRAWFDRPVTGLAAADFTVGGTSTTWTVGAPTGSGAGPYTVTMTSASPSNGTVIVTLKANSVADAANGALTGPAAATAAPAVVIDRSAPALSGLTLSPSSVARDRGFTVDVSATDSTTVTGGSVRVDGGAWEGMGPTDGAGGSTTEALTATLGGRVVQVSTGTDHTCALLSSGRVRCWGDNTWGQLGPGTGAPRRNVPIEISGVTDAISISSGYRHTCAVIAGGSVRCWGFDLYGQLGDGKTYPWAVPTPAAVPGITNAVGVSAGLYFTCALIADGTVRCWGFNSGELGDGTVADRLAPVRVLGITTATQITAGSNSACALLADHTIECWGNGSFGVLGTGSADSHRTPLAVSGITTAASVSLSVGGHQACAVLQDGTVRCWGSNEWGQLGDGTTTERDAPVQVTGLTNVTEVSVAYDFACARLATGSARCWGNNPWGQLGDGTTNQSSTPVVVGGVTTAASISANGAHACVVSTASVQSCWGLDYSGQLGDGTNTDRSSAAPVSGMRGPLGVGAHTVCVRATDGAGNTSAGGTCTSLTIVADTGAPTAAFGTMSPTNAATIWLQLGFAERVSGLAVGDLGRTGTATGCTIGSPTGGGASYRVAVSGCSAGTLALTLAAGSVTDDAGNAGPSGALTGATITIDRAPPVVGIPSLQPSATAPDHAVTVGSTSSDVSKVTAGALALDTGGWQPMDAGDGSFGGVSETLGGVVNLLTTATSIASGGGFTCALLADTTVRCWGENGLGQLGSGAGPNRTTPVEVPGLIGATAITAGSKHACAIVAGGSVKCWGDNSLYGQLGGGFNTPVSGLVTVGGLSGVVEISAGGNFTCAVLGSGGLRCWGANDYGMLGNGTTGHAFSPVAVSGISTATHVAAGYQHACATLANGTARCWGNGTLGDGVPLLTRQWSTTPVVVSGVSGATAIGAGHDLACVLIAAGAARCWGSNANGEIGDGTTTYALTPVPVSGLSGATALSVGGHHVCAVTAGGVVTCWGANLDGQIGDGTTTARSTPTPVAGLAAATDVASSALVSDVGATMFHTCATLADGSVACWGANGPGQLGDGSVADRASPASVIGLDPALAIGDHQVCVRATDGAGNTSSGSACSTLTIAPDNQPPSAAISAPSSPTKAATLMYTISFDERVTGLAAGDFTVTGSAAGCVVGTPAVATATSYTVAITGCSDGTVVLHLGAGTVEDLASNAGPASQANASSVTVDRAPPTATLTRPATPTAAASLGYSLVFNEPVTGLNAIDFARSGTAAGCTVGAPTGGGSSWNVAVTGCGSGTVILALKAASVTDAAGNVGPNAQATALTVTVDRTGPSVGAPSAIARSHVQVVGTSAPYQLAWTGSDGAGVARYELQQSVNGAAFTSLSTTLPSPIAYVGMAAGRTYRFRVRGVDTFGNVGAWATGPTLSTALVQQTSGSIHYAGSWATATSTVYSGGSTRFSKAGGASASYTFTGRSVALVSSFIAGRGRVKLYIDGAYVTWIDLSAAPAMYRSIAWQRTWAASGTHTFKVVAMDTTLPRIDLDAIATLR